MSLYKIVPIEWIKIKQEDKHHDCNSRHNVIFMKKSVSCKKKKLTHMSSSDIQLDSFSCYFYFDDCIRLQLNENSWTIWFMSVILSYQGGEKSLSLLLVSMGIHLSVPINVKPQKLLLKNLWNSYLTLCTSVKIPVRTSFTVWQWHMCHTNVSTTVIIGTIILPLIVMWFTNSRRRRWRW